MLKDCIEIFEKEIEGYKETNSNGDEISFITDDYALTAGTYYLLDIETGEVKETLDVDKNSPKDSLYNKIAIMYYLSDRYNADKSILSKTGKKIASNNIYSFIIPQPKKFFELGDEMIFDKLIPNYYSCMEKYTDKKKQKCREKFELEAGNVSVEDLQKTKKVVIDFLKNFPNKDANKRIGIFFDVNIDYYKKENRRYYSAYIYNKNDYNYFKHSGNEIIQVGLPDNNMGLNDDKPYLENKTRKKEIFSKKCLPVALNQEDVEKQKLYFDHLSNKSKAKCYYIVKEKIDKSKSIKETDFYMNINIDNDGITYINDYYIITNDTSKKYISINNYIENSNEKYNYEPKNLQTLLSDVDRILYEYKLKDNLYNINSKDSYFKDKPKLVSSIRDSNYAWINLFYKNNYKPLNAIFNKILSRVLDTFIEPPKKIDKTDFKILRSIAILRFNLIYSIKNYILEKENKEMSKLSVFPDLYEKIKDKISQNETAQFDDDKEAFFAMGQIAYYLMSKSKDKTSNHDVAIPFLTSIYSNNAKNEIFKLFRIRSYSIPLKWNKFKNLYAMVQEYNYPEKMDIESVLAGYLHNSLFWENLSKDNEKENSEE